VLDCSAVELLEKDAIIPSLFNWGNFISRLLTDVMKVNTFWYLHHLKWVRLHKESESVTTDFLSC